MTVKFIESAETKGKNKKMSDSVRKSTWWVFYEYDTNWTPKVVSKTKFFKWAWDAVWDWAAAAAAAKKAEEESQPKTWEL